MSERASLSLAAAVEEYYEELKAFVLRKVGCPALAADIVQETWLRTTVKTLQQPVQNARAYLYRVAGNLAIDHLRQEQARSRYVTSEPLPAELLSSEPAPEQTIEGRQEFSLLQDAVRELPKKCRLVFLL